MQIVSWPPCDLSDEEREYVSLYATTDRPGVKRRTYGADLVQTTFPGEISQLSQAVAFSGRYVRLFGFTFSGEIYAWTIKAYLVNEEQYIFDFCAVTTLIGATPRSQVACDTPINQVPPVVLQVPSFEPLIWDPNIRIEGTQQLIIEGRYIGTTPEESYRSPLHIALHCWEFPDTPLDTTGTFDNPSTRPTVGSTLDAKRKIAIAQERFNVKVGSAKNILQQGKKR